MRKKFKTAALAGLIFLVLCLFNITAVYASDIAVTFTDTAYVTLLGNKLKINVVISSQENIGTYHVELKYDKNCLRYLGGGENNSGDIIVMEGTGYGMMINYSLEFETISPCETGFSIVDAQVNNQDGDAMNFSSVTYVPVHIVRDVADADEDNVAYSIPVVGRAKAVTGEYYHIVDLKKYIPDNVDWRYAKTESVYGGKNTTFLTDTNRTVKYLYLMDADLKYHLYAYDTLKGQLYPCYELMEGSKKYYYMSPNVVEKWPESLSLSAVNSRNIVYAMNNSGICDFYEFDGKVLTPWNSDSGEDYDNQQSVKLIVVLVAGAFAIIIVARLAFVSTQQRRRRRRRRKRKNLKKSGRGNGKQAKAAKQVQSELEDDDEYIEFIDALEDVTGDEEILTEKEDDREPVVAVKDVSMCFKISTSSASSMKEYVIQKLKKEIKYRKLLALNHISFNIYKGEVVGIIGSNGSGKSTLLRIISGALQPTEGKVLADCSKVQLLTLGAGFDMELTAKENVYLNGAIIGYTKEFIDKNYKEIVEFAELENFMDEKVKNFSSGMVSRLAFSIATAGTVPEILILDEILSVGDEAFRIKSLNRIREMLYSGATVIMVSHSLNTIMENCTKAVWLEKGKLMAVGETKKVCDAYQKSVEANYTGILYKDHVWYYIKNGQPDYQFVGIAQNNYGFWFIRNGRVDFDYTGIAANKNGRWYINKGKVDFKYNGKFDDNGVIVTIVNGKVVAEEF